MCCMPHTVHLAAIKVIQYLQLQWAAEFDKYQLLEAIGAISKTDSNKAAT